MKYSNSIQSQSMPSKEPIQTLSDEDLALIAGGCSKEDEELAFISAMGKRLHKPI